MEVQANWAAIAERCIRTALQAHGLASNAELCQLKAWRMSGDTILRYGYGFSANRDMTIGVIIDLVINRIIITISLPDEDSEDTA